MNKCREAGGFNTVETADILRFIYVLCIAKVKSNKYFTKQSLLFSSLLINLVNFDIATRKSVVLKKIL